MKIRTLLVAATALLLSATAGRAQEPVPEFKDKVMLVKEDNSIANLESTDLQSEMNSSMTGNTTVSIKAIGAASGMQLSPAAKFIVRVEPGTDPEGAVELFQYAVEKKTRKLKVAAYSMGKAKDIELSKVRLAFSKVADGVYAIAPESALQSGEYVFIVNRPNIDIMSASGTRMKGFSFSVN